MDSADKIRLVEELAEELEALRARGKTIVQCHGVFDLTHPGHIRHFRAARQQGDILVVTVTPDQFVNKGPGRPVFNERLRAESLAALADVDYVAVTRWPTAVEAIRLLRPHVYCKGPDYATEDPTGVLALEAEAVRDAGGRVAFTADLAFSSTALLNEFYGVYPEAARRWLADFKTRHTLDGILGGLEALTALRVLVVGEAILDEYHYCAPLGKSPKEAIVSVRHLREETFAGGALACANHVAGFCGQVDLVTCLGEADPREAFVREHLRPNVRVFSVPRPGSTIIKRRYVWEPFLVKMFEVAFFEDAPISPGAEAALIGFLHGVLRPYDVMMIVDYGHGLLTPPIVEALTTMPGPLAVNTQANSANLGYNVITKYPRADYVCLDEPEARLARQDRWGPIEALAEDVQRQLDAAALVVTRGHLGSLVCGEDGSRWEIPAFSREVVDRVGAGDAYFSLTAPCVAAGMPLDVVGFLGNAAGALAVKIVGNRTPVEPAALAAFVRALLK